MKKLTGLLTICLSLILLVGCGAGKESAFTANTDMSGAQIEMLFEGKGDKVQTITQTTTLDLSDFSDEEKDAVVKAVEDASVALKEQLGEIEGFSQEVSISDPILSEIMIIDATNADTLNTLSEAGLLPTEGDASVLSMDATKESLSSAGYTITEK